MPRVLTLRAPAKINLTLRVGERLPDGFHTVQTIMQTIGLSDTLTLAKRRGPFVLKTKSADVPTDTTNLVSRAARALWRFAGPSGDPRDVLVTLTKGIPVAAGLGGGSADAAAALVGLDKIWNLRVPRPDLVRLAAELGSDVPFFLVGGTAIGTGRGHEVYPLTGIPPFGVIVIKPSFGVSTADAYRWLDEERAAGAAGPGRSVSELTVGWPAGPIALVNDLERPVSRRHPEVVAMVEACLAAGAKGAAMTGSGSAVFGVFPLAATPKAARAMRRPGWLVIETRTLSRAQAGHQMGL